MKGKEVTVAFDKNSVRLKEGDYVIWADPETGRSDYYTIYEIHSEELIKLANEHSELEALPNECELLVDHSTKWEYDFRERFSKCMEKLNNFNENLDATYPGDLSNIFNDKDLKKMYNKFIKSLEKIIDDANQTEDFEKWY